MLSVNKESLVLPSQYECILFIFSCLVALSGLLNTIVKRNAERKRLVPDVGAKPSVITKCAVSCKHLESALCEVEEVLFLVC